MEKNGMEKDLIKINQNMKLKMVMEKEKNMIMMGNQNLKENI